MNRKFSLLMDEENEHGPAGGAEGSEQNPVDVIDTAGEDGAELEEGAPEGGQPKQTVKPKVTPQPRQMTDEDFARLADTVVQRRMNANQQRQQREEPTLTPDQIEKLLNPVKVSREDMAELLGIEDPATISDKRLAKLQNLLNATVKNSSSISHVMMEKRMRTLMEQATPMQEFYQQQANRQYRQDFLTRHPKLEKFGKFIQFAATQVQPTKADGSEKSVEEAMDDIASVVKDMLKETGIDLDAQQEDNEDDNSSAPNTNRGAAPRTGVPKMTPMQGAGRSGGGAKKGASNNPDADIYT